MSNSKPPQQETSVGNKRQLTRVQEMIPSRTRRPGSVVHPGFPLSTRRSWISSLTGSRAVGTLSLVLIVVLLSLPASPAFSEIESSGQSQEGISLIVTVADKETRSPVSGAGVRVGGAKSISGSTETGGVFSIGGLKPLDELSITVSAKGYKTFALTGEVGTDITQSATCLLTPAAGVFSGTVVDAKTRKPVVGAAVETIGPGIDAVVVTSAGGTFTVDGLLEEDTVHITISAERHRTLSESVVFSEKVSGKVFALTPEDESLGLVVSSSPVDPAPHQALVVTATVHPRRPGVPISMRVIGTDGYHNAIQTVTNALGQATLFVPGSVEGVKDVVWVELPDEGVKKRLVYVF